MDFDHIGPIVAFFTGAVLIESGSGAEGLDTVRIMTVGARCIIGMNTLSVLCLYLLMTIAAIRARGTDIASRMVVGDVGMAIGAFQITVGKLSVAVRVDIEVAPALLDNRFIAVAPHTVRRAHCHGAGCRQGNKSCCLHTPQKDLDPRIIIHANCVRVTLRGNFF